MTTETNTKTLPNHSTHGLGKPYGASNLTFIFSYLFGRPRTHKVPTNGAYKWSPVMNFGATFDMFRAGAVPGAPGARRGPQGAEHRPKTRGRIYPLTKLCLEGFLLSNLKSRAMAHTPKLKPKSREFVGHKFAEFRFGDQ